MKQILLSQINQLLSFCKLVLQLEHNYMLIEKSIFLIQQNDGYTLSLSRKAHIMSL